MKDWKLRVDGSDNHWLDGVVGCAVAASMQGVELAEMKMRRVKVRRISYAEAMELRRLREAGIAVK